MFASANTKSQVQQESLSTVLVNLMSIKQQRGIYKLIRNSAWCYKCSSYGLPLGVKYGARVVEGPYGLYLLLPKPQKCADHLQGEVKH